MVRQPRRRPQADTGVIVQGAGAGKVESPRMRMIGGEFRPIGDRLN